MNGEDFLRRLHSAVVVAQAKSILDYRAAPPGRRKKSAEELQLSAWINGLDDASRRNVEFLLESAADSVIFGVLCILDGVRGIDAGQFEILHVDSMGKRQLLNGSEGEFLNDIYRGLFPPIMP